MSWLKDVIVDIVTTVLIIVAIFIPSPVLIGILWTYTVLMLIIKCVVFFGDSFSNLVSKANTKAPEWFSHLLYGLNTAAFLYMQRWYLAGLWLLIWVISFLTQRKINK